MNAIFSGSAETVLLYHSLYRVKATSGGGGRPLPPWPRVGGSPATAPHRVEPEQLGPRATPPGPAATSTSTGRRARRWATSPSTSAPTRCEPAGGDAYPHHHGGLPVGPHGARPAVPARHGRPHRRRRRLRAHQHRAGPRPVQAAGPDPRLDLRHHVAPERGPEPSRCATTASTWCCEHLRAKSDIWVPDVDLYYPYDGFTIITLEWIENTGGAAWARATTSSPRNWDAEGNRIMIDGRIPVNTHGGNHSEGGTQGSGHIREAITQLRGEAGDRQGRGGEDRLPDARRLLLQRPGPRPPHRLTAAQQHAPAGAGARREELHEQSRGSTRRTGCDRHRCRSRASGGRSPSTTHERVHGWSSPRARRRRSVRSLTRSRPVVGRRSGSPSTSASARRSTGWSR